MSENIWLCEGSRLGPTNVSFFTDEGVGLPASIPRSELVITKMELSAGVPLHVSKFPKRLYHSVKGVFQGDLPLIFNLGFPLVRKAAADIIRRHDMGAGKFVPVELFQMDGETPIDSDVSILCVGNAKDTVIFDRTPDIMSRFPAYDVHALPTTPKDDAVVTRGSAMSGADIWADPRIGGGSFFVSEELKQAFDDAGLTDQFCLYRTETDHSC